MLGWEDKDRDESLRDSLRLPQDDQEEEEEEESRLHCAPSYNFSNNNEIFKEEELDQANCQYDCNQGTAEEDPPPARNFAADWGSSGLLEEAVVDAGGQDHVEDRTRLWFRVADGPTVGHRKQD